MNNSSFKLSFPEYLKTLATLFDLRAYSVDRVKNGDTVQLTGKNAYNDGLGAFYVWDSSSSLVDDNNTVIRPISQSGPGRWIKTNTFYPGAVVNDLTGGATDIAPSQAVVKNAIETINTTVNSLQDLVKKSAHYVVLDYFGTGLSPTDDWGPAMSAASNAAGPGGVVYCPGRYTLNTEPYIQPGVTVLGPWTQPDEMLPGATADYGSRPGTFFFGSGSGMGDGLNVNAGCAWVGLTIIRAGLNLPFANATQATAGVAAFSNLAFNVAGPGATFRGLLILGFNKAIYSRGFERTRCVGVRGDCTNGIDIQLAYDIPEVEDCQFWPYTTVHQTWTTNALLRRTGTAFYGQDVNDWMRWTRCFSYGYFRGFHGRTVATVTFFLCGADNTSTGGVGDHPGALGFVIDGECVTPRWIGCQAAAQAIGFYYSNENGNHGNMTNCDAWAFSSAGTQVVQGRLTIVGGTMRTSTVAPGVANVGSGVNNEVNVIGMHFADLPTGTSNTSGSVLRTTNCTFKSVGVYAANAYIPTIASASSVTPNGTDLVFTLSGTTNIGTIGSPQRYAGKTVTFIVTNGLQFLVGGNIVTRSGANTAVAAGKTFTVACDGGSWYEI